MKHLSERSALFWALGLAATCAPACSPLGLPSRAADASTRAQAAVTAAQAARASEGPLPALHLQLAQTGLDEARCLQAAGNGARAQDALARAEADARLALALVQETAARARAEELRDRLTDLMNHLSVSGLDIDPAFEVDPP